MYNSLEHSVDASLMSAHFTTDTQMEWVASEEYTVMFNSLLLRYVFSGICSPLES